MGNDAKGLNDPGRTLQLAAPGPSEAGADAAAADGAFSAIGYEAADPSLHAPFWSEALQAGPTGRFAR